MMFALEVEIIKHLPWDWAMRGWRLDKPAPKSMICNVQLCNWFSGGDTSCIIPLTELKEHDDWREVVRIYVTNAVRMGLTYDETP